MYSDYTTFKSVTDTLQNQPFLKAHLKNGDLAIFFGEWEINGDNGNISGGGRYYGHKRDSLDNGILNIKLSDIALYETNAELISNDDKRGSALGILTAADLIMTTICILNPKACFGSCPTFYLDEATNLHYADAEGFSSSILPSLKARDIDALNNSKLESQLLSITLKNEALETHVIDKIKVLAVPRDGNERIYHSTSDDFYSANSIIDISSMEGVQDSLQDNLMRRDAVEWFSPAHPKDLSQKEEIILSYKSSLISEIKSFGFSLAFRQSLMTTFLFYNMMDYLGDMAPSFNANIEKGNISPDIIKEMYETLGGIEVFISVSSIDTWEYIGSFNEAGPIAINQQIIPFMPITEGDEIRIKLKMTQGLWRLDNADLVPDIKPVIPISLNPLWIEKEGSLDNEALEAIKNDGENLITMPGDQYKLGFELPEKSDYEIFIDSEGYYLEWLRPEWMETKNLKKLILFVNNPKKYLRKEAGSYKLYEDHMEQVFWNSKIN